MKSLSKFEGGILALAMVFPSLLTYVYFVHLAGTPSGTQQTAYAVGKVLQFALPVFWIGIVYRERWLMRRPRQIGSEGILFGAVVFLAMFLLYAFWLSGSNGVLGPGSNARNAVLAKITGLNLDVYKLAVVGFFYSIVHSGLEEYYWRWFVFGRLQKYMPWFIAAVISSLGFMAHHVILLGTYFGYDSPYCWLGSLGVAVGGFYWAWLYRRSDSIWGPWIGHGIVDAAIFSIGVGMLIEQQWPIL